MQPSDLRASWLAVSLTGSVRAWAGLVQCWAEDSSCRGAYANFGPGQYGYKERLGRAHGRVAFAGEHTAMWCGYMNGAIESGHRAAWEIYALLGGGGGGG